MAYLATSSGLVTADPSGGWRITVRSLDGFTVTAVAAQNEVVLAGTTEGIHRSEDGGRTWREANRGLLHRHIRWLAYHPDTPGMAFAGTEPAGIFIARDGGETWQECPEVAVMRDRFQWSLPYSPEAGCVRGFAFNGERAYAAVEVGGVLRSDDGGQTWRMAEGSDGRPNFQSPAAPWIHADVHSIAAHPQSPDLVYAPTGGGFYRSTDGGKTWRCHYECYARAAWIDPADAEHILLGPASGVDREGRIEESWDGGASWQPAQGQAGPWARHMVERFVPVGAEMAAVLSNGELLVRPLGGGAWNIIVNEVEVLGANPQD